MRDLGIEALSDITVFSKYAKYLESESRRETWNEIVDRYEQMMVKKYPKMEKAIAEAIEFIRDKKVLPSMRALQFAGAAAEVNHSRIYNCCFLPVDDYHAFSEAMFLLLGGTGVGYSVQKQHVAKLPEIKTPGEKRKYLIEDSIMGWADAVKVLMKAYLEGNFMPDFDFRGIRKKGARLKTAGGKAPGPEPLKTALFHVQTILDRKKEGEKLTPLECHDMLCHIANSVLAGGIRRSAMISLFSHDDEEMITCKYGNWWELNEQRGRANNSAVLLRGAITEEEFMSLWKRIEVAQTGEPGIYWSNDLEWGTNPCCEIALRPFQFCVSGDTNLITREGIDKIENLVGKEVEIWNGENWSKVTPYQTGTSDTLHRVWFSDGSYLDATDNHKFLVKNRFEKKYREVETIELIRLLETSKYQLQIPRSNIKYDDGVDIKDAYDFGFVLGDGCVHKNYISAGLFNKDKKLNFSSARHVSNLVNYNGTPFESVRFELDVDFCKELKYSCGLPKSIFTWNKQSILKFIAGWADADGSNASKGIRIYGSELKLRDAQLLLTKVGIPSSVNLMQKKGVKTNLCERKEDVWYLQVTLTAEIPCQRLVCNNVALSDKCKNQTIKRIDTLEGVHNSFCLTEGELHQCVFNNVLTKQCNLCEVNVSDVSTQEELNNRVATAAFLGTLQAGFTDFHYLRPIWQKTTQKDALLGIGMTGIASGEVLKYDLEIAAHVAKVMNSMISEKLGINEAARITCIKPSGTTSLVLGTSSGIHAWHNDYYLRTMRFNKNEDLAAYLMVNHPELCEDDKFRPNEVVCVRIPVKAPEGSILRTESAIDTLERVKKFSTEWIKPGHQSGMNTHNVSATIPLSANDWAPVGEWMWENRDHYNGLSVFPYDNHTYEQAPFEDITKEEYEERIQHVKHLDLSKVMEIDDNVEFTQVSACSGAQCEINI